MSRLKTDAIRNVNASVDGITLDTSGNVAIPNELQLADKIVHTGDTNTAIRFSGADTVSVETAGTERLRVTSAGSLIVGNQTASNYKLCVSEAAHTRVEVISTNNNSAGAWFKVFNGGSITSQSTIRTSGGSLQIYTGTSSESERLRIDQYGRVMIGTTTAGDGGADDLNIATTGQTGITIRSGTGSGGQIFFADGTSGDDRQRGIISYQHGGNYMRFYTDALERFRIDSNGMSKFTRGSTGTVGHFYANARESNILIQNDARTWKIVNYDYGNNGTDHLGFHDGTTDRVIIQNTGGISFNGDTATSNALSDYEEGTFSFNESTISVSNYGMRYVKIGKMVYLTGRIVLGNSSDSGIVNMTGIPFSPDTNISNSAQAGYVGESNITNSLTPIHFALETSGTPVVRIRTDNMTAITRSQAAGYNYRFSMWYLAAS